MGIGVTFYHISKTFQRLDLKNNSVLEKIGAKYVITLDCVTDLLHDTFEDGEDISESEEDKILVKACFKVFQSLLESSGMEGGMRKFKVEPDAILLPNQLWIMRPLHELTFIGKFVLYSNILGNFPMKT